MLNASWFRGGIITELGAQPLRIVTEFGAQPLRKCLAPKCSISYSHIDSVCRPKQGLFNIGSGENQKEQNVRTAGGE